MSVFPERLDKTLDFPKLRGRYLQAPTGSDCRHSPNVCEAVNYAVSVINLCSSLIKTFNDGSSPSHVR